MAWLGSHSSCVCETMSPGVKRGLLSYKTKQTLGLTRGGGEIWGKGRLRPALELSDESVKTRKVRTGLLC